MLSITNSINSPGRESGHCINQELECVGIEFSQFGRRFDRYPSLDGNETNIQSESIELLDGELSGILRFALTVSEARTHRSRGNALGIAIPFGFGGVATYSRHLVGNLVEPIDCEFEETPKNIFEL